MDASQIDKAVTTRARVRISKNLGWAAGVEGIAMGYRSTYDNIKVGFVDAEGNYTGEYTMVPRNSVEMVEVAAAEVATVPASGVARILADLDRLNDEIAASVTVPEDITDSLGRTWKWRDGLYRHGRSAAPRSLIQTL